MSCTAGDPKENLILDTVAKAANQRVDGLRLIALGLVFRM